MYEDFLQYLYQYIPSSWVYSTQNFTRFRVITDKILAFKLRINQINNPQENDTKKKILILKVASVQTQIDAHFVQLIKDKVLISTF